ERPVVELVPLSVRLWITIISAIESMQAIIEEEIDHGELVDRDDVGACPELLEVYDINDHYVYELCADFQRQIQRFPRPLRYDAYSYRKDRISLGSVDEGHVAQNFTDRRRPVIGSEGHPDIAYARGCRLHTLSEDAAARSGHDADTGERALMAGIKSEQVSGYEQRCRATDRRKGYSSASLCDIGSREWVYAVINTIVHGGVLLQQRGKVPIYVPMYGCYIKS
ncbi:hypothetical protein THAOC_36796, partial [Thalassiosira oceanica]